MRIKLATAPNRKELEEVINEFYKSTNYIINEDLEIYNKLNKKTLKSVQVKIKNGRWVFGAV